MPTIWTEGPLSSKSSVSNAPSSKHLILGHSTSAPVLPFEQCTQALDSSWWRPGPGIHSEAKLLILVSSTAVSKPVLFLLAHPKKPEGVLHLLQQLAGIGGDRIHPCTPEQGEEPGLVHYKQVH